MRKYTFPVFKVLGLVGLFFVALLALNTIAHFAVQAGLAASITDIIHNILYLGVTILIVLLYLKGDKKSFADIGVSFEKGWHKKLLRGAAEGAVIMLTILAVLLITGLGAIRGYNFTEAGAIIKTILYGIFHYLLIVALVEELISRGYMYHFLKTKYTSAGAVLTTSLIFSLMHIFNSNVTILAFFNIFLIGIAINLLVLRDKTIWSAVGFHFTWNFVMGTVFSSPVSGGSRTGIIKYSLKGYELLTGGCFGVEGGLICTIAVLLLCAYIAYRKQFWEHFAAGLRRPKNVWFAGLLVVIMLASLIVESATWISPEVKSDSLEINQLERFLSVNEYTMQLELDINGKKLEGSQKISYINNSTDKLKELYFHIYPNAFSKLDGGIVITSAAVHDKPVDYKIEGADNTLLLIPLEDELYPGQRCEITMEYTISIPHKGGNGFGDRFGYGDNTYNLGNFFPIAAVYDKGWDKHLYDNKGDAFYSETSNFEVELTAPDKQVIASTGQIMETLNVENDKKTWNISAPAVRDFAFVASDMFKEAQVTVNGTIIKSYSSSELKAKKVMNISADAIKMFNKKFGKYPYPTVSIVQSDIGGGMEYPNLIMIEAASYNNLGLRNAFSFLIYGSFLGELEHVVVHELAHQWWYSLVGNDEYREPWIDEPLTEYSTLLYYKEKYGEKSFNRVYKFSAKMSAASVIMNPSMNQSMRRSLDEFEEDEYYLLIYGKGAMMFKDLNDNLGDKGFEGFVRTLYDKYKFKVVSGEELIALASQAAGKDMNEFFQKWLDTPYTSDELK